LQETGEGTAARMRCQSVSTRASVESYYTQHTDEFGELEKLENLESAEGAVLRQGVLQVRTQDGECSDDGHLASAIGPSRITGNGASPMHRPLGDGLRDLAAQLESMHSGVLSLARTAAEERGPWARYDNLDKVDYASGIDIEAMVCNTEQDLRAVQRRVEEKGYDGFAVVKGMACLKKCGKPLTLDDLQPAEHRNSFWIYTPALAKAEAEAATKIQARFRGQKARASARRKAELPGFQTGIYVLSDDVDVHEVH